MTLIEKPAFRDGNMQLVNTFECEPKRFNCAALKAGKTNIQFNAFFLNKLSGFSRFFQTGFRQANIVKSCKTVFQIPLGLPMADEDKLGHRKVFSGDNLNAL